MDRILRVAGPEPSLTVRPQPGKQLLAVLGAAAFMAVGVWLLVQDDFFLRAVGVLSIVVFGFFGVIGVAFLARGRAALVVDRRGITDGVSAVGAGFVPWSEITGLGTWTYRGQTIVVVGVADPEAILARVGPMARIPMRANVKLCGSPVTIPTNVLPLSADQLIAEIAVFAP